MRIKHLHSVIKASEHVQHSLNHCPELFFFFSFTSTIHNIDFYYKAHRYQNKINTGTRTAGYSLNRNTEVVYSQALAPVSGSVEDEQPKQRCHTSAALLGVS